MKRISLILAMLFGALIVNAHQGTGNTEEEFGTVFCKGGQAKAGWFLGLDGGYSQFDKKDVWMGGISGGMIINHNFSIGLAGRGWTNRNELYYPAVTDTAGAYLEGGYGGLLLEYTLFPKSAVHVTFPVLIGGGGASYVNEDDCYDWDNDWDDDWDDHHSTLDSDAFFVIEPGVRAEVNLLKFMRLNAGVSYRYTSGLDLINTSNTLN